MKTKLQIALIAAIVASCCQNASNTYNVPITIKVGDNKDAVVELLKKKGIFQEKERLSPKSEIVTNVNAMNMLLFNPPSGPYIALECINETIEMIALQDRNTHIITKVKEYTLK